MSLDYQKVIHLGILYELANVFCDPDSVKELLTAVGFPKERIPTWQAGMISLTIWRRICEEIDSGILNGGFESLLIEARKRYPNNLKFIGDFSSRNDSFSHTGNDSAIVVVTGCSNWRHLIDALDKANENSGKSSDSVNFGFCCKEGLLLNLEGWTVEEGLRFADELEPRLQEYGETVRTAVGKAELRDCLVGRLFAVIMSTAGENETQ
jgi:hypothetical protein